MARSNTEKDFWSRVNVGASDECWEWLGPRHHFGHGATCFRGRSAKAHRVAWIHTFGEIPEGQILRHRCDNPPCCNPRHLTLGSNADNVADMVSKKRHPHGERH